jgi:hypothetical protein
MAGSWPARILAQAAGGPPLSIGAIGAGRELQKPISGVSVFSARHGGLMSWTAQVAETPLMLGFWTLGSTGALLTHAWNVVFEVQPSFLDRLDRSIGTTPGPPAKAPHARFTRVCQTFASCSRAMRRAHRHHCSQDAGAEAAAVLTAPRIEGRAKLRRLSRLGERRSCSRAGRSPFGTWACSPVLSVISLQMVIFPSGLDLGSPRGEGGRLSVEIAAVMPRIAVLP